MEFGDARPSPMEPVKRVIEIFIDGGKLLEPCVSFGRQQVALVMS